MSNVAVNVPFYPIIVPPCVEGGNQQLVVGTTSQRLANQSTKVRLVLIKNDDDSNGNLYVCIDGNDCSVDRGFKLAPGHHVSIAIDDLYKVTVVGDGDNVKIYVMWCR